MAQENKGGLHYSSDITLPKVKYFLLSTGLEKKNAKTEQKTNNNNKKIPQNPLVLKKYLFL